MIQYMSGRRISGVSGDTKPTDVELGSRFEQTDTRYMYYYADPLSVDDDLSTDK